MLLGIIGILSAIGAFLGGFLFGFFYSRSSGSKELKQLKASAGSQRVTLEAAEQGARDAAKERDNARQELDTANSTLDLLKEEVRNLNTTLEEWADEGSHSDQTISELKAKLAAEPPQPASGKAISGDDTARLNKQLALAQSEVKQAKKTAKDAMTKAQAEDAASKKLKEEIAVLKEQLASSEEQKVEEAGWCLDEDPKGDASGTSTEQQAALQEELAALKRELDQAKEALAAAGESQSAPTKEPSAEPFSSDKGSSIWSAPRSEPAPKKDTVNPFDMTGSSPNATKPSGFASANPFAHLTTKARSEPSPVESPAAEPKAPVPQPAPTAPEPEAAEKIVEAKREPPPPKEGGPTVMDVLETDPNLNPGIREAVRTIYVRYAPGVKKSQTAEIKESMTVMEALETDPNLNRGQKETLRSVISRVAPKT